MPLEEAVTLVAHGRRDARVSVIIPLYNYEMSIIQALNTVVAQRYRDIAVIVVDDCSTDRSREVVTAWMDAHADDGLGLFLYRNSANARLATTRNTGLSLAQSEFCFFLDADNQLYPRCVEKHVAALDARPDAAAAYGMIEVFEARGDVIGTNVFSRDRLKHGNYIDAMAMIRATALRALGGYHDIRHGWEDYDLWLRLWEARGHAVHIPEILSRYREHAASMLRTETNVSANQRALRDDMVRRHPWLDLY